VSIFVHFVSNLLSVRDLAPTSVRVRKNITF
jgi:hypothetical protein